MCSSDLAGKALASHLATMAMFKKNPYSKSMKLSSTKEKNDDGDTFAAFSITPGESLSQEFVDVAMFWLSVIKDKRPVIVDEPVMERSGASDAPF